MEPGAVNNTNDAAGATYVKSYSVAGAKLEPKTVVGKRDGGSYQLGVVGKADQQALAILSLDSNGNVIWARQFDNKSVDSDVDYIKGVAEATDGSVWVTGPSSLGATVLKLDGGDGRRVFRQAYDSAEQRVDISAIAAGADGGFVAAGTIHSSTSEERPIPGGDLWMIHASNGGVVERLRIDDLPNEIDAETVRGLEVDSRNNETVVYGEQSTSGNRNNEPENRNNDPENRDNEPENRSGELWAALFHSGGAVGFSTRHSQGSANDAVMIPRVVGSSNADVPGLVVVGSNTAYFRGDDPRLLYFDLPSGELNQNEQMDLDSLSPDPSYNYEYVGVALSSDVNGVVAAANRYVPCPEGDCAQREGVLQVLRRDLDARSGQLKFVNLSLVSATDLGLPSGATFRGLERTTLGTHVVLADLGGETALVHIQRGLPCDEPPQDVLACAVVQSRPIFSASHISALRDGGILAWNEGSLVRFSPGGTEIWSKKFARSTALVSEPVDVAEVADGGALVATDGSLLLSYSSEGVLHSVRRFAGLKIRALEPLDGGRGLGSSVLMLAEQPVGPVLRLRLSPSGEVIDTAEIPGTKVIQSVVESTTTFVSRSKDRLLIAAGGDSLWWFDLAGNAISKWTGSFPGFPRATPDGGVWFPTASDEDEGTGFDKTVLLLWRYDRDGRFLSGRKTTLVVDGLVPSAVSFRGATVRADGGLFVFGYAVLDRRGDTCGDPATCSDGLVVSFDWEGRFSWAHAYGAGRKETFADVQVTKSAVGTGDDGVLLGGVSTSYAFPTESLFVVRTDADGLVTPGCAALAPSPLQVQSVDLAPLRDFVVTSASLEPIPMNPSFAELIPEDAALDVITARSCSGDSLAPELTIQVEGEGKVGISPAFGIDCPGDCAQIFAKGSLVPLTAAPAPGQEFEGWGGDCASFGMTATIELELNGSKACSARFRSATDPGPGQCTMDADCASACQTQCGGPPQVADCIETAHQCSCTCSPGPGQCTMDADCASTCQTQCSGPPQVADCIETAHQCSCTCSPGPGQCTMDADCTSTCQAQCGGPPQVADCIETAHQCSCTCSDAEPDCSNGQCTSVLVSWEINGETPQGGACDPRWNVSLSVDGVQMASQGCFTDRPALLSLPPGVHELVALLYNQDGVLNVERQFVTVAGTEVSVTIAFEVLSLVDFSWFVNGYVNGMSHCPPGGTVTIERAGLRLFGPLPCTDYGLSTVMVPSGQTPLVFNLLDSANRTSQAMVGGPRGSGGLVSIFIDIPCPCCANPPPGSVCE